MTEKTDKQLSTVANAYPNEIRESVAQNARGTSYPGAKNGPADAYRHMLGIAEIRRRANHPAARAAGDWNETEGRDTPIVWPPHDLAGSSEVERILGKPTRLWTADNARKVMQDRIYAQSTHPRQAEAFEKVRKHFKHRYPAPTRGRPATQSSADGGPVHVDA